jgi:hypothetical protein
MSTDLGGGYPMNPKVAHQAELVRSGSAYSTFRGITENVIGENFTETDY